MTLSGTFRELFRDPGAERELAALGAHVTLPTFNLSTTSLRHIPKWLQRLRDIQNNEIGRHPNFVSDPESLGLVRRIGNTVRVTEAGKQFLNVGAGLGASSHARAEYELVRILYYSGISHSASAQDFLSRKRQNLFRFLAESHLSPTADVVLSDPKLLAIAEAIYQFPGALHRFLELPREMLDAVGNIGEPGFKQLWKEDRAPVGLGRLAKKIGSDYTRASDRRLHFLLAILLHEMRVNVARQGLLVDRVTIPDPFSRLVSETALALHASSYTDELRVVQEAGRTLVFLAPSVVAVAPPNIAQVGIKRARGGRSRAQAGEPVKREPVPPRPFIDIVLTKEAEDYIERAVLIPKYRQDHQIVRVGHTSLEQTFLADGMVPGADFYILKLGIPGIVGYFEVKSSLNSPPSTVSVTRAEFARAKKCAVERIPYELMVVTFHEGQPVPQVYQMPEFGSEVATYSIDDLRAFDVMLNYR